jgi:hypothetical protein
LSDTGSERAGGGAAALLLAEFGRLASTGRVELPFGVLAFPCALPAQREAVATGDEMLVGAAKEVSAGAADHQCRILTAVRQSRIGMAALLGLVRRSTEIPADARLRSSWRSGS